ncbi:malectin domain-containing carbohydrate-binding protein [Olivibacter domesticus]|uniref:Glycosyl hydrolases family 2, TIM barrel domain n=1 Tax=Olivibacter domesticus TaxID=407022 RepID=A0A1H7U0U8_OLID1|nr:malectin domain-containing carbohydrate-binding protein [Olivibacter domesticus]SEL90611.1 protein of unknown function [Olivibacter domesticus]
MKIKLIILYIALFITHRIQAQQIRQDYLLDSNWFTIAHDTDSTAYLGFEKSSYNTAKWKPVNVPHNWDTYHGYRRLLHGNRHGYAWYRKKFKVAKIPDDKHYFLYFEGVGSYATVWLNGKKVGYHAGGRTTFTLDVTEAIVLGGDNIVAVRADHPASIRNLPWVCGGCSEERGFSEGSQPMGIFRPVHLQVTNATRIEPFGVHIWNDTTVSEKNAQLHLETEIKNYGAYKKKITLINRLVDRNGDLVISVKSSKDIDPGSTLIFKQKTPDFKDVHLWSPSSPYLYTMVTEVIADGEVIDHVNTPYGIRWISWPIDRKDKDNRFFINGKPFFINGIAEYEHLLGGSHAFSEEQVKARVQQIQSAGFNAFRDAHQPHNLRYQQYWDKLGILSWTQMAAHIWFDNQSFKDNFKKLLTDWVKERRNSPSVVLWGLENESTLPEDFARECSDLIRQLDPTASTQRKVTTCNGGSGTDWDVPQNWTGTYGGDPNTYAEDLKKQVLVGEYGAWRTIDFHAEAPFNKETAHSEERMTQLMETKVRLAETVRDSVAGHFFWLFNSHDNPGRIQGGEGLRDIDRIGPVNYKGLFTPWDEPVDAFYMFRSNYVDAKEQAMVYIVSHTWPDRWQHAGIKDEITVYSNCEEVELFNDVDGVSLGRHQRQGIGIPFKWNHVNVRYNVLYAIGYRNGRKVATDVIILRGLPQSPNFSKLYKGEEKVVDNSNYHYLYRINCGGPAYKDHEGNLWQADRQRTDETALGSSSWTANFQDLPNTFASQRRIFDPIKGTVDWPLLQTFRYGREELNFNFPVPDGEYLVELYFVEPWFGTGGGMHAEGWRLFDVSINDSTVERNIDIWKEVGHDAVLKKTYAVQAKNGLITLDFPRVASSQAVISAIAIASKKKSAKTIENTSLLVKQLKVSSNLQVSLESWLDIGDKLFIGSKEYFTKLPSHFYGAEWLNFSKKAPKSNSAISFSLHKESDIFVLVPSDLKGDNDNWLKDYEDTHTIVETSAHSGRNLRVFRRRLKGGSIFHFMQRNLLPLYPIIIVPVTKLQSAHDLKPVTTYKPSQTAIQGKIDQTTFLEKEALIVRSNDLSQIDWPIATGVADTYSIMFRYANETTEKKDAILILRSLDGQILHQEKLSFSPSKKDKWGYLYTNTGTMINAGKYVLSLKMEGSKQLILSNLEIQ